MTNRKLEWLIKPVIVTVIGGLIVVVVAYFLFPGPYEKDTELKELSYSI